MAEWPPYGKELLSRLPNVLFVLCSVARAHETPYRLVVMFGFEGKTLGQFVLDNDNIIQVFF